MATPGGTLDVLPDEVLLRIFFEYCPDAVSNGTIQRLSTVYSALISKYAPSENRLRAVLLRAGVPFWVGPGRPLPFLKRKPFAFEGAQFPFFGPGRAEFNRRGGSATFQIPGVPASAFSRLSTSQARVELLPVPRASTARGRQDHWWTAAVDTLLAMTAAEPDLSRAERARVTAHYALLRSAFAVASGPGGRAPHLLVVSMPLLGVLPGAAPFEAVHLLIPFSGAVGRPAGALGKARVLSRAVVAVGGAAAIQTTRRYRLLLSPHAKSAGRLRAFGCPALCPTITTHELAPLEPVSAAAETARALRVARFKADFHRYRRHRWTTEDWTAHVGLKILSHLEFLNRAFADTARSFWDPGKTERWLGLEDWNHRKRKGAKYAAVLAEFTTNALVTSAYDPANLARYKEIFGRVGVRHWKTEALVALVAVCDDIRPLLFGGRHEVVVDFGPRGYDCAAEALGFALVLDGTTVLTRSLCGCRVRHAEWAERPGQRCLRTGRIRLSRGPQYFVADACFGK